MVYIVSDNRGKNLTYFSDHHTQLGSCTYEYGMTKEISIAAEKEPVFDLSHIWLMDSNSKRTKAFENVLKKLDKITSGLLVNDVIYTLAGYQGILHSLNGFISDKFNLNDTCHPYGHGVHYRGPKQGKDEVTPGDAYDFAHGVLKGEIKDWQEQVEEMAARTGADIDSLATWLVFLGAADMCFEVEINDAEGQQQRINAANMYLDLAKTAMLEGVENNNTFHHSIEHKFGELKKDFENALRGSKLFEPDYPAYYEKLRRYEDMVDFAISKQQKKNKHLSDLKTFVQVAKHAVRGAAYCWNDTLLEPVTEISKLKEARRHGPEKGPAL